jgi:hypothetical protein
MRASCVSSLSRRERGEPQMWGRAEGRVRVVHAGAIAPHPPTPFRGPGGTFSRREKAK